MSSPAGQAQSTLDAAAGQAVFEKNWVSAPSSTHSSDGLGPFYNARSCAACHPDAGRSRNTVGLTVALADPVYGQQLQPYATGGLKAEGALELSSQAILLELAGESFSLTKPALALTGLRYGALSSGFSLRQAPALAGLAQLELVSADFIKVLADPQDLNGDGIAGKISWVGVDSDSTAQPRQIGRFGWKAEMPGLRDQIMRALQLDMGLSSAAYPAGWGDCSTAQADCRAQPNGNTPAQDQVEVGNLMVDLLETYLRSLPVPARIKQDQVAEQLFAQIGCQQCHRPELPLANGATISPYSDLLLHDMGQELADLNNCPTRCALWRTAPLWALDPVAGLLHDGRAHSISEAVLWHGGEGSAARDAWLQLENKSQDILIRYLLGL